MKEIRQGIKKSDLEQWDGFRHIFKFTIFDIEEECSECKISDWKKQMPGQSWWGGNVGPSPPH